MSDRHETIADIIAEKRREANYIVQVAQGKHHTWRDKAEDEARDILREAERIEAAWRRERQMIIDEANDDTALVKNCATCKHYCRNKKYCPAQDTVNVNPDILPIFRTGPCDKWKCKYTKK